MNAKKLPPNSSPAAFAPASVRSRKIESGTRGAFTRLSITRNGGRAARMTLGARAIVLVAPQPYCGAWAIASTSSTRAPVPAIAPSGVKRAVRGGVAGCRGRSAVRAQRGGADRDVEVEDVLPAGVPGEKPAGDHANGRAAGPSPPQIPSALLRSAPSANMFITIERAAGSMIAAPSPWTARAPIAKRHRSPARLPATPP